MPLDQSDPKVYIISLFQTLVDDLYIKSECQPAGDLLCGPYRLDILDCGNLLAITCNQYVL